MRKLEAALALAPDAVRGLGALGVSTAEDAERLRERLRLANAEYARLASMADGWWHLSSHWDEQEGRVLLYRLGPERYTDRVLLAWTRSSEAADPRWHSLATLAIALERSGFSYQVRRLRRPRHSTRAPRWAPLSRPPSRRGSLPAFPTMGRRWRPSRMRRHESHGEVVIPAPLLMPPDCPPARRLCWYGTRSKRAGFVPGASWPDATRPLRCFALHCGEMRRVTNTTRRPADVARRSAKALAGNAPARDAFRRETFALPREAAREKAREMFRRFPKAAYMTEIEILAGAARRSHRIHHAASSQRGLRRGRPRRERSMERARGCIARAYGRTTSTIFHGLMMSTIRLSSGLTINTRLPSFAYL